MTTNDDTLWVDQLPVGAEGPYLPGLRLHKVRSEVSNARGLGAAVAFALGVVLFFLLWRNSGWAPFVPNLLQFLSVLVVAASPAFCNARDAYQLFDDNGDTPEFGDTPEPLPGVLRHLAASEALRDRLTPPEAGASNPSAFWTLFPSWAHARPITAVAFWVYVLAQALVVIDGFFVSEAYTLSDAISLASVVVVLIPVIWMYSRVTAGERELGTGDPFADSQRPPKRFSDVSSAALQWDAFLCRPYLQLELHGEPLRYYSPVSDPLHLLRVAKYRMPQLELQV